LPLYPLVLLVCVSVWKQRMVRWGWLAVLTAIAFFADLRIDPPYAFAPEDNLTYRDMIVLHQQAIHLIAQRFPQATVLTAWPATTELEHPDLGYTRIPIKVDPIDNFSLAEIQKAATDPGGYDTALVFSTKWVPPYGRLDLTRLHERTDAKLFDFHRDLPPATIASLLHGDIVWQSSRNGEWAAVLRFPRVVEARISPLPTMGQIRSQVAPLYNRPCAEAFVPPPADRPFAAPHSLCARLGPGSPGLRRRQGSRRPRRSGSAL
jgi:hypothetical protein